MLPPSFVESAARGDAVGRPRAAAARRASRRPASSAAARSFGVGFTLGLLGLTWVAFVLARLIETWRVSPASGTHELLVFGQRLSYPTANAGAIVVLGLAVLGLLVLVAGAHSLARELIAERRLRRAVAGRRELGLRRAWLIEGRRPQAFCAGLVRPRVYLTLAAVELLDARELQAVLAHECHHASRRDPLRLACGRVLADALFFLPALRRLVDRQRALAEIGADEAAVADAGGDRSALASAMLSFTGSPAAEGVGLDPERIDFLLGGEGARLGLPRAACAGVGIVLAALTLAAVLAARTAAGSLTLALPLLSRQPCVLVLALIPAAIGLLGVVYGRVLASRAGRIFR